MGRLFWKIFFGFWLTMVAVGVGVGLVVHWYAEERLEQTNGLAAGPRAELALIAVATTLQYAGTTETKTLLRVWHGGHESPVLVVDDQGRELLGRPVPRATLAQARSELDGARKVNGVRRVTAPDGSQYFLFVPVELVPHPPLHWYAEPLFLRLGVTFLASMLFSAGLAWYLTRPVRHLRAATRRLAEGALDTRVMPLMGTRRDEIADFGRDFDHMAGRLQALVGAQARLLHDVSHELRSPLARLHVAVGLARQQPETIASTLDRIDRETQRLDDLVGEVLTLSRLEAGVSGGADEYLDITGLLEAVVEDAQFEAKARGCRVELRADGEMLMKGRAELLRRAFENVIRNAIAYTAQGTSVEVEAKREATGDRVFVSICDLGPGVPASDLEAVFEPFFRAGNNATRGGYGLGLTIARRAIIAHGGTIRATNRAGGGLCVEISLPLVAAVSESA